MADVATTLISAGGSLLGSLLGKSKGPRRATAIARDAILAQEKYGINALELIRSGAGQGMTAPKIGSPTAFSNAFDTVSDLLTGKTAQEAEMNRVRLELAKLELAKEQALAKNPANARGPRVMSPSTAAAAAAKDAGWKPGYPEPRHKDDIGSTEGRQEEQMPTQNKSGYSVVNNRFTFGDLYLPGEEVDTSDMILSAPIWVPQLAYNIGYSMGPLVFGPDADDVHPAKEKMILEKRVREAEGTEVPWSSDYGPKPSGWATWSNAEKIAYLHQIGK